MDGLISCQERIKAGESSVVWYTETPWCLCWKTYKNACVSNTGNCLHKNKFKQDINMSFQEMGTTSRIQMAMDYDEWLEVRDRNTDIRNSRSSVNGKIYEVPNTWHYRQRQSRTCFKKFETVWHIVSKCPKLT